jgi:hypothetical protein
MFNQVQIRALAVPLKDIQGLVPKPLLRCLGCVLRVIVLLEGEPSPQSEVLSVLLWSRFSSRITVYFAPFTFPSILTSLPVPATEKHAHRIMLPPPCLTVDVMLGIQAKEFNLGFIRPENVVSHDLRDFRCLLANSKRAVMCLLLRSGFHLATLS